MDTGLIEAAILKAIAVGAKPASPIYPLIDNDLDVVRAQTDVEMEPDPFSEYVVELGRDPDMQLFDQTFATVPTGGSVSIKLHSVARLLLAQAISSKDVSGTVERFRSYVEKNTAPVIAVMAVSGVTSDREVQLGPHIRLAPMISLPPSVQRGTALGQPFFRPASDPSIPIRSALITEFKYGPIFHRRSVGEEPGSPAQAVEAVDTLNQARCLLSLLGVGATYRQAWVQAKDPLISVGLGTGTFITFDGYFGPDNQIDAAAAEKLAASYFGINKKRRHDALRIPLDRLDRANRFRDFADTSIDLGIALEALLLHDLDKVNRGELRLRLSLRGAWLAGTDEGQRADIQRTLKDVYDLRSSAVHSGVVKRNKENRDTISRGIDLCRQLIRKTIDAKANINWDRLVLGGPSPVE